MKGSVALALLGALLLGHSGCGEETAEDASGAAQARPAPEAFVADGPHDVAVLDMGELGEIRIELLPELAPATVDFFRRLAREGVYDGTYFHRVIPGFVIQGGDPNTRDNDPRNDGMGGEEGVPDELSDYPHVRGTVSMANRGRANSGDTQFFIVLEDQPHLDRRHSVFGRVIEGLEVVDAITGLEIDKFGRYGPRDRPYPVSAVIEAIRFEHRDEAAVGG